MYILNIAGTIKKMFVNEIREFIFENFYKTIVFFKENSYYSMKCLKKIYYCKLLQSIHKLYINQPRL